MKYNPRSGIAAGQLSHKVEIYNTIETQDETGQPVKSSVFASYAWAHIAPLSGYEKTQSGRENLAAIMYRAEIRYNNLSVTDTIKWNGYQMRIISLAPMGRYNRERVEVLLEVIEASKIEV